MLSILLLNLDILTFLCYLELHSKKWVEVLPSAYSTCAIRCYGGSKQLRALSSKVSCFKMVTRKLTNWLIFFMELFKFQCITIFYKIFIYLKYVWTFLLEPSSCCSFCNCCKNEQKIRKCIVLWISNFRSCFNDRMEYGICETCFEKPGMEWYFQKNFLY